MPTLLQTSQVLEQLDQLSDVQLPTLALLAVLGFIVIMGGFIGMMVLIVRGQSSRDHSARQVIEILTDEVRASRQSSDTMAKGFDLLRADRELDRSSVATAMETNVTALNTNMNTQADRAIHAVNLKLDEKTGMLQTGLNALGAQLESVNTMLTALGDNHNVSQAETKGTLDAVKQMLGDAITYIKAREAAEPPVPPFIYNNGEARLDEILKASGE